MMAQQYAAFLSLLTFLAVSLNGAVQSDDFLNTAQLAVAMVFLTYPLGWWLGELGRQTAEDLAALDLQKQTQSRHETHFQ